MTSMFGVDGRESRGRRRVVSASSLSASSLLYVTLTLACLYDSQHKTMGMNGGGDVPMEGGVEGGGCLFVLVQPLHRRRTLWRQRSLACVIIHTVSNQPSTPPPPLPTPFSSSSTVADLPLPRSDWRSGQLAYDPVERICFTHMTVFHPFFRPTKSSIMSPVRTTRALLDSRSVDQKRLHVTFGVILEAVNRIYPGFRHMAQIFPSTLDDDDDDWCHTGRHTPSTWAATAL